jgi:regulator of protease activity HflC (stomatin/prohibitin superfamily)
MRKFTWWCIALLFSVVITSCHGVRPEAGEESVLIYKPWFFGHGGVDMNPVQTGLTWCWWSTSSETFKIIPQKNQVDMEDLVSNDNTPLDFHTVIITQIKSGKSPILLQNYGLDWFNTNLYNHYCNRVRDYVSQHSPFDLMSNREVLNEIDNKLLAEMRAFIADLSKEKEFPVEIKQVVIGKAIPNKEQLEEMNKTAKAVQAKQTQDRETEVQVAREKAERQRAIADKAYMREMGLNPQQFIQLKAWDIIAQKQGANIDVLFNADATMKMWNVKEK